MTDLAVPTCNEAEDALASVLLAAPDKVAPLIVGANLDQRSFVQPDVGLVVQAALNRWRDRKPVDLMLIQGDMKGLVEPYRMMHLATCCAVPAAAEHYLNEVAEAHSRRQIISGCQEAAMIASSAGKDDAIEHMTKVMQVVSRPTSSKPSTIKHLIREAVCELENKRADRDVPTTWKSLDRISPVRMGDYVVIAAPAKGGKSTLALSYVAEACKQGYSVLIASLEMPQGDVVEKLLAREARVTLGSLYSRVFSDSDNRKIFEGAKRMACWNLEIRDDLYSIDQIAAAARMSHARKSLSILVVDYIQLVRGPKNLGGSSREREVAEVSRTLRLLSLELGCVVIGLSQLNDDGRLRESRAIGQDATAVWAVMDSEEAGCKQVQIPAQRNAESGVSCDLLFEGQYSSFSEP